MLVVPVRPESGFSGTRRPAESHWLTRNTVLMVLVALMWMSGIPRSRDALPGTDA